MKSFSALSSSFDVNAVLDVSLVFSSSCSFSSKKTSIWVDSSLSWNVDASSYHIEMR